MSKRIYVGNLSFNTSADELREVFGEYGEVVSASVVSDRETGRSRGFAFVEMSDGAENAIEALNGQEVGGRTLTVNEARPREERRSGGGGGGGGGRGGYGGGGGGGGRGGYGGGGSGGGGGGYGGGGGGGYRNWSQSQSFIYSVQQRRATAGATLFSLHNRSIDLQNKINTKALPETFYDFELIPPIQRALHSEGYHTPTPIQAASIGPLLEGKDLLGCAQTGTGKTAAFAIPILQKLELADRQPRAKSPRVLVLSPTRELATQIAASFDIYGKHLKFRVTTVFGGVSQGRQVRALERGVHVCVATPGRLLDLFQQGCIWFDDIDTFVLDEADRMLDMGFMPDLKRILKELPEERQSLFFSATMPPEVKKLAAGLLTDHVEVIVTPPSSTVDRIKQSLLLVESGNKLKLLLHVLDTDATGQVLIFTKTKRGADRLAKQLQ